MRSIQRVKMVVLESMSIKDMVLVLIAVAGCINLVQFILFHSMLMPRMDFPAFYSASVALHGGVEAASLYDKEGFFEIVSKSFGANPGHLLWLYPPPLLWLVEPLYFFEPDTAYLIWSFLTLLPIGFAAWIAGARGLVWAALVLNPTTVALMAFGKTDALFLLMLCISIFGRRRGIVGMSLGLLLLKPQLALAALIILCYRRQFSVLAIAMVTVAALVSQSSATYGFDAWQAFVESGLAFSHMVRAGYLPWPMLIPTFALFESFGVPGAYAAHVVVAIISFLSCIWVLRCNWDQEKKIGAIVLLCLLLPPYVTWAGLSLAIIPIVNAMKLPGWNASLMLIVYTLFPSVNLISIRYLDRSFGALVVLLLLYLLIMAGSAPASYTLDKKH